MRRPLCIHHWERIGQADDRLRGRCHVVRCCHCGARDQIEVTRDPVYLL
ncbi:hypothetical protein [Acuticoccus mangrovi]|uniref:Uncharacterized protein n=1 Tax=Acuticoccus mangrovi TaxID=2796142 RepID=A0A934IIC0_9HYPH|nr:hypothetical protein [Acuticoccus mangrovi]MBJ3777259.1 hypothetical protein [Acuticoccus mangrovi]